MENNVIFRASYGFVQGPVFKGQALVVAQPSKRTPWAAGPSLKVATGLPGETFYGIALTQQLSHFGFATKVSVVEGALVGKTISAAMDFLLGMYYVKGSEHVVRNNESVDDMQTVLVEGDVLQIDYQYPLSYTDYVKQQGETAFFSFDHTHITQMPCGREGQYVTQYYVAKPYKPLQSLKLARGGRFQPAKKSSPAKIPGIRVLSPPSPANPYLGVEID